LSIESVASTSPLNASPAGPAELEAEEIATERLMGHDPELSPREEAIFLLHTAAEVEHALLVPRSKWTTRWHFLTWNRIGGVYIAI
jgi:hypothetical protein